MLLKIASPSLILLLKHVVAQTRQKYLGEIYK